MIRAATATAGLLALAAAGAFELPRQWNPSLLQENDPPRAREVMFRGTPRDSIRATNASEAIRMGYFPVPTTPERPPAPVPLHAQDELFAEGNRLYQQEDYRGALDSYLRIRDAGFESRALYYNIGNAYFKIDELGRAILFYERARRLAPNDADVLANLELARSLGTDEIVPLPRFWLFRVGSWWTNLLPRSLLVGIATAGYLVATGAATTLVLGLGAAAWARRAVVAGGMLALLAGTTLTVRETGLGQTAQAVVLVAEVGVQSAPSDDPAFQLFVIHEGTRVRVDRRSAEWLEVVLEDGKVGWVRAEALEEV